MFFQKNGGISAKSSRNIGKKGPARPAEILGLNGPAQFVKPEIYNPDSNLIFKQTTEIFVSSNMSLKISEGHLDQKLSDSQTMVK